MVRGKKLINYRQRESLSYKFWIAPMGILFCVDEEGNFSDFYLPTENPSGKCLLSL